MDTYIIGLRSSFDELSEDQKKDMSRQELIDFARGKGAEIKQRLIDFLESEGLMDQVENIGEPMVLPTLFIQCSPDVAEAIREADIEGITDVAENQRVELIRPVIPGPGPGGFGPC